MVGGEGEALGVRRPGGGVALGSEVRHAAAPRAIGSRDADLPNVAPGGAVGVRDPASVRRPRRLALLREVVGQASFPRPVGVHHPDVAAVTRPRERDAPPVGRPRRALVARGRGRQPARARAVGIHDVDVERPLPRTHERHPRPVRRPCRFGLELDSRGCRGVAFVVRQASLARSVRVHEVDRVVGVS